MTYKLKLYLIFFGVLELGLTIFFSIFIWTSLIDSDYYLPTVINLFLLGITLFFVFCKFFSRKKAKAYLSGLVMRIFFAGSVFVICQIGFIAFEHRSIDYVWLIISITINIFAVIYWFGKEKRVWKLTLKVLEKCGKLNIENGYFKIKGGFYSANDKPNNSNKNATFIGYTIVIGVVILRMLGNNFGENFRNVLLRFGFLFMSYFMGMLLGKIFLWTSEICKLEKKLGIEFVTEFAKISRPGFRGGRKSKVKV